MKIMISLMGLLLLILKVRAGMELVISVLVTLLAVVWTLLAIPTEGDLVHLHLVLPTLVGKS